jgi:flavin-dependent dehydrogenase
MKTTGASQPLQDGSVVAIVGAGPAGSFFALLALMEAASRGIRIRPILFDGKSFLQEGPPGCNMCAGVISWKLVQEIEQLGLQIPSDRVQRRIRSYVFHTREGSHTVISPPGRGPVPVVFRGNGPRFSQEKRKISFDDFLLEEALKRGAEIVPHNVDDLSLDADVSRKPRVSWQEGTLEADLVVVACGVSSRLGRKLFQGKGIAYRFPRCVRAYQAELDLGQQDLERHLGDSIHVFSLGVPGIRFAAVIPKTRFATVTLVGRDDLQHDHLLALLQTPTVRQLLPVGWRLPEKYCSCRPRLPVRGAGRFYGNRLVFIGDMSMTRYYKNGIDSAFRTARQAVTAVFDHGVSARTLRRSYFIPVRKEFTREHHYARLLFSGNDFVATRPFWVRAHLYHVRNHPRGRTAQTLHFLTWNLFTGDTDYRDIFWTGANPRFLCRMLLAGVFPRRPGPEPARERPHPRQPAVLRPEPRPLGPLVNGNTVVIVGGGPGGTACGIALKKAAMERGISLRIVLYEGKIFQNETHYNQCAGVLSPPLEELLQTDLGLALPASMVQRTIHSYRLCHADQEIRLTSGTHRSLAVRRCLWDQFMLEQAAVQGVEVHSCRVTSLENGEGGVIVYAENGTVRADVVVGAFGMDPGTASVFEQWVSYRRPEVMETIVTKIHPGEEWMEQRFSDEILAFLPGIPGVSFGAITPKRDHVTVNIAGSRVTSSAMDRFLRLPEVKRWLPPGREIRSVAEECHKGLFPNRPASVFFADRFVAVGDAAGLVRPFKGKGITSACVTGIAAAKTMMDYGISRKAFHAYRLACRDILADRTYGWAMQRLVDLFRRTGSVKVLLRMAKEDAGLRRALFLSVSGQESYRNIFRDGFALSRAARILAEVLGDKIRPGSG